MTEAEGTKKTGPTGVPSTSLVSSIAAASPSVVQPWLDWLVWLVWMVANADLCVLSLAS